MESQADELLNTVTDEDAELGDAILGEMMLGASAYGDGDSDFDNGEEPHIVIGRDRFITVPEQLKRIAVQFDNEIETVTFDCPRYWDGHDLSEMKIYINYIRSDRAIGSYPVDSGVTVDEDDENIIHFNWTIKREVTLAYGGIVFLVCAKDVDDAGNEEEHWNSELCKDLYVSEGLEAVAAIAEEYPDLITHLLVRMDDVENRTTLDSMLGYLDKYFTTDAQINTVLNNYITEYLENDPETLTTVSNMVNGYIESTLKPTDKTLTVDGGVADAKVAGDRIVNLETGISTLENDITNLENEIANLENEIATLKLAISAINAALPYTINIDDVAKTIDFVDRNA